MTKLISIIKAEAKNQSIKKMFVDTYAFQAQEFYKKTSTILCLQL